MIEWALIQQIWPLIVTIVGVVIWGIRLEGQVAILKRDARDTRSELQTHYATKDSVTEIGGRVAAVVPQLSDIKAGMARVEQKLDALLLKDAR
jgi:hypothetical protein